MEHDSLLMMPLAAARERDVQATAATEAGAGDYCGGESEDEARQQEHSAMLPPCPSPPPPPAPRTCHRLSQDSDIERGTIADHNITSATTQTDDVISCGGCGEHITLPPTQQEALMSMTPMTKPPSTCASRASITSVYVDVCRICHCEAETEPNRPLIAPCMCAGSLKFVHQACLQQWIKSADTKSCELCKFDFEMTTKIKPFRKWSRLDMTTVERRKIMCSVTFHVIAITCVIWSLYVLIDRTTEELKDDKLEWPFWTKLIVVAIGFTGGLVFMYVQCKMYVQLCRRWRAYNRVIHIENAPDKKVRPPDIQLAAVKTMKTDV